MSRCYVFLKARLLFSPTTLDLTCHVFSREMSHRVFACTSLYWSNYFISHRIQVWYLYIPLWSIMCIYICIYIYLRILTIKKSTIHGSVNYTVHSFPMVWPHMGTHGYSLQASTAPGLAPPLASPYAVPWALRISAYGNGRSLRFGYENHENPWKNPFLDGSNSMGFFGYNHVILKFRLENGCY